MLGVMIIFQKPVCLVQVRHLFLILVHIFYVTLLDLIFFHKNVLLLEVIIVIWMSEIIFCFAFLSAKTFTHK